MAQNESTLLTSVDESAINAIHRPYDSKVQADSEKRQFTLDHTIAWQTNDNVAHTAYTVVVRRPAINRDGLVCTIVRVFVDKANGLKARKSSGMYKARVVGYDAESDSLSASNRPCNGEGTPLQTFTLERMADSMQVIKKAYRLAHKHNNEAYSELPARITADIVDEIIAY